jgi:hypothetical protein
MHLFYQKPYQLYGKMKKVNKPGAMWITPPEKRISEGAWIEF